jgi:1,5-anhydro-D-fructose reductase (1,5-anhydro-D-mannitol-forming)
MIVVGILGYGTMGKIRYENLINYPGVKIKYVYDPLISNSNVVNTKSIEDVFNDKEINTLFICTPNKFNFEYTKRGLLCGKNIFCEKPPAFSSTEVLELRQIEKLTSLCLMYGFNHRHHKSVQLIKSYVESGEFGNLIWMRGRYGKSVDENFFNNWRADHQSVGGGILMDQGIHMLDLFLYLQNDLKPHSALVSNYYWNHDSLEDNVFANFKSENSKVVASLHSTMTQWRHLFSLEVFLEKGYITLNGLITSSGSYGKETITIAKNRTTAPRASWSDEENIVFDEDNFWLSEIDYFLNCIKNNAPIDFCNSNDAFNVMDNIEKIYKLGKVF